MPTKKLNEIQTTYELVFDGDKVSSFWYNPELAPLLCALCGKECEDKTLCFNTNPYCG
jgi:hypothetical protein